MPLHDVGYRRWSGKEKGYRMRWFAITNKGFEIALRSQIVRRMMFLAWLPALYFGFGFFLFEKFVEQSLIVRAQDGIHSAADVAEDLIEKSNLENKDELQQDVERGREQLDRGAGRLSRQALQRTPLGGFVKFLGDGSDKVIDAMAKGDDKTRRRTVWSFLLLKFLKGPQGLALLLLIGWVSAPLIAKDLRTKAFLLYFSRPLSNWNYLFGKLMILIILSMVITTLPAFILYFVGIGLSPNLDALEQTWDLPFRLVAVSMIHIIPASMLALMFSSLTTDSRFAHFAWYAMWILGFATWALIEMIVRAGLAQRDIAQLMHTVGIEEGGAWVYVSLYHTINLAQGWAMGVTDQPIAASIAFGWLCLISLVALFVTWLRINKAVLV